MSDNRKAFKEWAVSNCVFTEGDIAYGTSDVKAGFKIWQAATEQSSKEIERLNALVSMQAEALKNARASFLALQPNFGGPIAAQMGKAVERINDALSASPESAAWEESKLLPLQRQVARLYELLCVLRAWSYTAGDIEDDYRTHELFPLNFNPTTQKPLWNAIINALANTQATAEAFMREHDAKVLEDFIKTLRGIPSIGLSERQFGELERATKVKE